jgi:hypothetical protein
MIDCIYYFSFGRIRYPIGKVLALMKAILAFVVAITLIVPSKNSALGKEASPESNTMSKCQLVQQALMIEIYPKIKSVLRESL